MTLLRYDGFDNWSNDDFRTRCYMLNTLYLSSLTDRFGNTDGAYRAERAWRHDPPKLLTNSWVLGFAFKNCGREAELTIGDNSLTYCLVKVIWAIGNSFQVQSCQGSSGSSGGMTTRYQGYYPATKWTYFEIEYYPHNTTGYFKLYQNSVLVYSDSTAGVWFNSNSLGNCVEGQTAKVEMGAGDYDDMYWLDMDATSPNTALGEVHVEELTPTANGTTNNGIASAGSNYECVDEIPYNEDTDYVTLDAIDEIELYTISNLSVSDGDIHAIQVRNVCKKPTVGHREIQAILRVNGTNYTHGTAIGVQGEYSITDLHIFVLNPDDSQAWTVADVNGMESGVKITA